MVSKLRTHKRFSCNVRMKRSATPLPSGSRTKLGELSIPKNRPPVGNRQPGSSSRGRGADAAHRRPRRRWGRSVRGHLGESAPGPQTGCHAWPHGDRCTRPYRHELPTRRNTEREVHSGVVTRAIDFTRDCGRLVVSQVEPLQTLLSKNVDVEPCDYIRPIRPALPHPATGQPNLPCDKPCCDSGTPKGVSQRGLRRDPESNATTLSSRRSPPRNQPQ